MSLIDDLDAAPENARRPSPQHPTGWEPGVEWLGNGGRVIAATEQQKPDWTSLLEMWGLDPAQYEVDGDTVQWRSWDAAIGKGEVRRMYYHRADVRQRRAGGPDVDALIAHIRTHRPRKRPAPTDAEGAYFLCLNDWQLGKRGTTATIERIQRAIDASVERVAELRRVGRPIDVIYLAGIGDMIESCDGHYPNQRFEVELNSREQRAVTRDLILSAIKLHAPLAGRIVVPCAPGNHGENNRVDGKSTTGFGDNSDLEVFENVAVALRENQKAYGHVSFLIPRDQLTITVQPVADGPIIGLAHGHQARRGGGDAMQKVAAWVAGQAFGQRPIGDAQIVVTGHFHQYAVSDNGGRAIFIAPTIDSGSQWYAETAGVDSTPGMLSFLVRKGGYSDHQVL